MTIKTQKICTQCGEEKPITEFFKRKALSDGHYSECKKCNLNRTKKWFEKNPDYQKSDERKRVKSEYFQRNKEYLVGKSKIWRKNHRDIMREMVAKYRKENPEKSIAHHNVSIAISDGRLVRPAECQICCSSGRIEAHHNSYSPEHWLDVMWVCKKCHYDIHHGQSGKVWMGTDLSKCDFWRKQ